MSSINATGFLKELAPIPFIHRWISKKRLKNYDFTLLTPNCLGGWIYHNLGLQFKSPTINLRFNTISDFYKFCSNLDYYLKLELTNCSNDEVNSIGEEYPMARLGDIIIHLVHYKTFAEGYDKWEERKKRINFDNIYIIANDYVNDKTRLSVEKIQAFGELKCKNVVVFTQEEMKIPHTLYLGTKKLKDLQKTNKITGLKGFEVNFDYVKFLNETKEK